MADRRIRTLLTPNQLAAALDALRQRQGDMHLPLAAQAYQTAYAALVSAQDQYEERRLFIKERNRSNRRS